MSGRHVFVLAGGKGTRLGSSEPKVLTKVGDRSMLDRVIEAARGSSADRIFAILSHRADEVAAHLDPDIEVVLEDKPRGTGAATASGVSEHPELEGTVVVTFGDMPYVNPASLRRLFEAVEGGCDAALLTFVTNSPPQFSRVMRDAEGHLLGLKQFQDCSEADLQIKEIDAGAFAFSVAALRDFIFNLSSENAQGEFYLTDVLQMCVESGRAVTTVKAETLDECLGVNRPEHLDFANRLDVFRREAEPRMGLADAFAALM